MRRGVVALASAVLAVVSAGCGPAPTASPSASSTGSGAPSSAASPTGSPAATASTSGSARAVAADPNLLAFVPAEVDSIGVTYDPATTAQVAADPTLARDAVGLAVGIAVVPEASASEDLAVVSVVRLRDPSVGEDWFRSWRDTSDTAACAPAGGVAGHAQATIGNRTVFIGSCAGGAFTYHVRLVPQGIVVSVTSLGVRRLGEKLIRGMSPA